MSILTAENALKELLTAVKYAGLKDFGVGEPNHCYEARIPDTFVENAERALAALTPPAEGDVVEIVRRLRAASDLNGGLAHIVEIRTGAAHDQSKIAIRIADINAAADLLTHLSAEVEQLQKITLAAIQKKDELHLKLEPLQNQLLCENGARVAAERERDEVVAKMASVFETAASICDGVTVAERYIRWPCWNPRGEIIKGCDAHELAKALAKEFRALATIKEPKP